MIVDKINGFTVTAVTDILVDGKIYNEPGLYPDNTHVADIRLEGYQHYIIELHTCKSIKAYTAEFNDINNKKDIPLTELRAMVGSATMFKLMNDSKCRMEYNGKLVCDKKGKYITGEEYILKFMFEDSDGNRIQIPKELLSDNMLYDIYREFVAFSDEDEIGVHSYGCLIKYLINNRDSFENLLDFMNTNFKIVRYDSINMIYDNAKRSNDNTIQNNPFYYGVYMNRAIPTVYIVDGNDIKAFLSPEVCFESYFEADGEELSPDDIEDMIGTLTDENINTFMKDKAVKGIPIFALYKTFFRKNKRIEYRVSFAYSPKQLMSATPKSLITLLNIEYGGI